MLVKRYENAEKIDELPSKKPIYADLKSSYRMNVFIHLRNTKGVYSKRYFIVRKTNPFLATLGFEQIKFLSSIIWFFIF